MSHSTARHLIWLGLLLAVLFLIGFGASYITHTLPVQKADTKIPAPPPTKDDYVTAQHGFQYLISRTDAGFSPASLIIKKGETVRFFNGANSTLALTLSSAPSKSLSRGQYFEYTFKNTGNFDYSDGTHNGVVIVR